MKILKWVELPGQEIEVDISGIDAVNAMLEGCEDWTPEQLVRKACNNFLTVIRKFPDSAIAAQAPEARKIIADVFEAQALRFRKEFPPAMPMRIQRKRTKGWKMPEGTVYVGRPTKDGNPWTIQECGGAAMAVLAFRNARSTQPQVRADIRRRLRGKDLACWCGLCPRHQRGKPLGETCDECPPCHADVLLEIANGFVLELPRG